MKNSYKNVLITGAGKGIGESTVKLFLSKGYYVYALIKNKKDNTKFKNFHNISIINGNVNNTKLAGSKYLDAIKYKLDSSPEIIPKLLKIDGRK